MRIPSVYSLVTLRRSREYSWAVPTPEAQSLNKSSSSTRRFLTAASSSAVSRRVWKPLFLDPHRDGLRQMAVILARPPLTNLSSISIVGHGSSGTIDIGGTTLDGADLSTYTAELAKIGAALAPSGDLQLYACDVGQGAAGDAFLQQLSQATGGANIAAASHLVGSAAEGGSWDPRMSMSALPMSRARLRQRRPPPIPACSASPPTWFGISESSTTDLAHRGLHGRCERRRSGHQPHRLQSTPSSWFRNRRRPRDRPGRRPLFRGQLSPDRPRRHESDYRGQYHRRGTPSVIYTSGNSGGDAIVGLAFDQLNDLLYLAVTDVNVPGSNTDTGIYTISALGTGTRTATTGQSQQRRQAPNDIAIDTTHNLLFYTNGVPGLTSVEEVGVANLTTGVIINGDLVSYSASGNVDPTGSPSIPRPIRSTGRP